MKIAIARQKYTPYGGAERFVQRALDGLRAQGVEVTVIAREWADEGNGDGQGLLRCDPFYLGRTWRDVGFSHCVQRIIAEGRFDLVQSHERIPGCHVYRAGDGVHATWLELRDRARGGIARLLTGRSPWHSYVKQAEAAMFRHADLRAVICNSRMVRDDIAQRFDVAAEKLHVIHNGVDLAHFHPGLRTEHRRRVRAELGIDEQAPLVLFVGSGFERKGVPALLRALAQMTRPDAHAVIVGKDRGQQDAEQLARRLGIDARVHFLGGRQDVRPYYGAADVFALPTLYDPFPNAALEALACGLPLLTSPTSGAAELVDARFGVVVDALDFAAQSRALERLLALDPVSAGAAARAAAATCALPDMTARLMSFYDRLASPPRPV